MGTKGSSYRYGNKNGTASSRINYPYARPIFIGKNPKDHMAKHFKDFNISNSEAYIAKAVNFGNDIDRVNYDSYVDKSGTTYKYNKLTNELLIVSKEGYIITYFIPTYENGAKKGKLNLEYFNNHKKKEEDYDRIFGKR